MDNKVLVWVWAKLPNEIKHEILKASLDDLEVPAILHVGGLMTWQLRTDSFFREVYRLAWTSRNFAVHLYAVCCSYPRPSCMPQPSFHFAKIELKKFIYLQGLRAALIYLRMLQQSFGKVDSSNIMFQSMITDAEYRESQFFASFIFAYEVKVVYSQMYSVDGGISLVRSHHGIWFRTEENSLPSDSGCDVFLFELDRSYGFEDCGDIIREILAKWRRAGRRAIIEV